MTDNLEQMKKDQKQAIAIAYSIIYAINEFANSGSFDRNLTNYAYQGLFNTDSDDCNVIFGSNQGYLDEALDIFAERLKSNKLHQATLSNFYVLLDITVKLMFNTEIKEKLIAHLKGIKENQSTFSINDVSVNQENADFYTDNLRNISDVPMMIYGKNSSYSQPHNITLIRSLLLAAVRYAYLYFQLGGSRNLDLD